MKKFLHQQGDSQRYQLKTWHIWAWCEVCPWKNWWKLGKWRTKKKKKKEKVMAGLKRCLQQMNSIWPFCCFWQRNKNKNLPLDRKKYVTHELSEMMPQWRRESLYSIYICVYFVKRSRICQILRTHQFDCLVKFPSFHFFLSLSTCLVARELKCRRVYWELLIR